MHHRDQKELADTNSASFLPRHTHHIKCDDNGIDIGIVAEEDALFIGSALLHCIITHLDSRTASQLCLFSHLSCTGMDCCNCNPDQLRNTWDLSVRTDNHRDRLPARPFHIRPSKVYKYRRTPRRPGTGHQAILHQRAAQCNERRRSKKRRTRHTNVSATFSSYQNTTCRVEL